MATNSTTKREGSLADQAYIGLRDRLLTLEIAPGDPIDEDRLAAELEMGRTPVREAIKRLALEDLIEVFPRRGTFASDIQLTDLSAISEVRSELEGYAAGLAANRWGSADEPGFDELLKKLKTVKRSGNSPDKMELDSEVHRFVYGCTRNPYLESTLSRFFNLSVRIWYFVLNRLPDAYSVDEHRELLEAIRKRDEDGSRKIAVQHVESFAKAVRAVL
jgi:DNA-binding GntR family transcriptional regulator